MATRIGLLLSCGAGALALATAVHAQATQSVTSPETEQAQSTSTTGQNAITQVVVTAERRSESLQSVPVAVSAYTSAQRELTGVLTTQDISNFTPGLSYSSQLDRISLRGIGRLTNVLAADPGVATYIDGIYTSSTVSSGRSPLFIERVEVLRGPQGTLYGRNSIGGAINTISRRPRDVWEGETRFTYGSYNRSVLEGTISGPITDNVQFRLAGTKEDQKDGYFDNVVEGMPDEGNTINTYYVEGQLQFQLGDNFEGWMKLAQTGANNAGGGPGARASYNPSPYNTTQVGPAVIIYNGTYGCSPNVTNVVFAPGASCVNPASKDPRKFAADTTTTVKGSVIDFAGDFRYKFANADLRYVVGAARTKYELVSDLDGTGIQSFRLPGPFVPALGGFLPGVQMFPRYSFNYQQNNRLASHEVTLSSTDGGPFQYIVGAYYYKETYQQPVTTTLADQPQILNPVQVVPGAPTLVNSTRRVFDSRPEFKNTSKALFGQIDYQFNDLWKISAGLRYSEDQKTGTEKLRALCVAVNACTGFAPELIAGGFPIPLVVDLTYIPTVVSAPASTALLPPGVVSLTTYDANGFASRKYDKTFQAMSGTAGIEYQPDNRTLYFAKYSRGYKAGGFRTGVDILYSPRPLTTEETVDAFELGLKHQIFDRRLQTNISAFFYKYHDLQIPLTVTNTSGALAASDAILFNVPESESLGLELETIFQPVKNFQLIFNYGYLDAKVTEGLAIDPSDPAALGPKASPIATVCTAATCATDIYTVGVPNGGFQRFQNLNGNPLPNSPKHKIALSANYTFETGIGTFTPSMTYIWRDEQYGSVFDGDQWKAPSWDQIDARVTFRDVNDRVSIVLYGRNLADSLGYESGAGAARHAGTINQNPFLGQPQINTVQRTTSNYFITPPRTYGIELRYRFF